MRSLLAWGGKEGGGGLSGYRETRKNLNKKSPVLLYTNNFNIYRDENIVCMIIHISSCLIQISNRLKLT